MASATVRWIKGQQFIGIDSTQHSAVLSTVAEGVGMKPSDLLLVAIGACTAVDVVEILKKKRTPVTSLDIQVSGEQNVDPPWAFTSIHLKYLLSGPGLTEKSVAQAIELAEEKYCSVSATVKGVAKVTTSFEILPEGE